MTSPATQREAAQRAYVKAIKDCDFQLFKARAALEYNDILTEEMDRLIHFIHDEIMKLLTPKEQPE